MIGIICSTWEEIKGIKAILSKSEDGEWEEVRYISGKISDKALILGITGVGIKRARKVTSFIIQRFKPDLIISAGFGGALTPNLKVGDIVIGEWVLSLKKNEKRTLLSDLPHFEHEFIKGGLLTENRFIYNPIKKKKLFEESGALAVDMETWGVAEAALKSGVKVLTIRSISDEFYEKLPDMGSIFDARNVLDKKKAFNYFLSHPSHIIPYLRFAKLNSKKASNSLSNFLRKVIFVV